jgi:hypothetical protein
MAEKEKGQLSRGKSTARSERLAAALRANLRRRKAQARDRAAESKPTEGAAGPASDKARGDADA